MIIFYKHHYYDDEIYNLRVILLSLGDMFFNTQHGDVHPPLSYLLNKAIYELFSSYKAILVFSILFNVGALAYFYHFAERKLDDIHAKLLLFMFVFINGGLLLWTNSVRWYAYWTPLFIILYTYLLKHQKLATKHLLIVGLLLSVMTYISYLTFLLLTALLILVLVSRKNDFSIRNILILGSVYFSLCAYQIYVFLTVHIHNKESQISNLINSIPNAVYGVINGGSVFLADPVFLVFSLLTLIIIISGLKAVLTSNKTNSPLLIQSIVLFVGLLTLMIITGVSGKYRNNIALSIPFYFIISYFLVTIKNINIKRIYLFFGFIVSIISIFNLVMHQNTAKNSYNMPVAKLAIFLQNPNNKIIFTYDPVTYFYLKNQKYNVQYLLDKLPERTIDKRTNIFLIKTYQGSLDDNLYGKILKKYGAIAACMRKVHREEIGIDKYYKIKNKLPGGRPKMNRVQMYVTYGKIKHRFNCHALR